MSGAISLRRQCDGFPIALTLGHHGPGHAFNLVGQRDSRDLGGSSRQQCCEPRPVLGAVDLGIADHRERAGHEQAAQIAIALFADTTEPVLATARALLWYQPDPGREVAA